MAAQKQETCYPSQAMQVRKPAGTGLPDITYKPFCTKCNAKNPHTYSSCCTSGGSRNSSTHYAPCSTYCNTSPNTVCAVYQAYCNINHQDIIDHADVGAHPEIKCTSKDQFIFRNWTHTYWNSLIDKIDTAETVGLTLAFGKGPTATPVVGDPTNIPHPANSLVTAEKYNQIVSKLNRFLFDGGPGGRDDRLTEVKGAAQVGCEKADVIRGAHALALVNGYNAAKFTNGVCDVCNANSQTNPTCDCNCSCPCSCNCGCSCPCQCDCSCSCGCGSS